MVGIEDADIPRLEVGQGTAGLLEIIMDGVAIHGIVLGDRVVESVFGPAIEKEPLVICVIDTIILERTECGAFEPHSAAGIRDGVILQAEQIAISEIDPIIVTCGFEVSYVDILAPAGLDGISAEYLVG
jgi:hypothetical protein